MKKCPVCNTEIQDDAEVCHQCGNVFSASPVSRKKRPAGRTAIVAAGFLVLAFLCSAISSGMKPTTQIEALLPGLMIGLAGWVAIILFFVAIMQAILNRVGKNG